MDENLACLGRLARAAGSSATLKVCWRRLWEAFPPAWGVRRLELVHSGAGPDLHVFSVGVSGDQESSWSGSRPVAGSFAAELLRGFTVGIREVKAVDYCDATPPTKALAGFALELSRAPQRCVILHLKRPFAALRLPPELVEGMIRIFEAAVAHVDLVDRVATLSQRAHQESHQLRAELDRLTEQPEIVAESSAMRSVLDLATQVADHDISVLILGESGTGKELVARHVHRQSKRRAGPFVAVNCGALPETLIESELFGHEKGAFTGATGRRLGSFERAHRGTIFLDEVGDLPLTSQVKLLRVLQERRFVRVGGERDIELDVRVIAATHRPLEEMVAEKAFRSDLYYRLRGFPLEIPPLRERPEDIAAIVRLRLAQLCRRMKRPIPTVSPTTLASLCASPWPGNVRELENALERALILSPGEELKAQSLSASKLPLAKPRSVETFRESSVRAITRALEASKGRIYGQGGAADLLGLKPSTLQTKMEKLGIPRTPGRS